MNFKNTILWRSRDDLRLLEDRMKIVEHKYILNQGRIRNNDSNYWKHYFNEFAIYFNINPAHIQVGIKCTALRITRVIKIQGSLEQNR